jgi:hypothetical protein
MPSTEDLPPRPIDEQELDRMFSALVDGMLSHEDRARLEVLLMADAAARRRYLEFMQTEFLLASEIGFGEASADAAAIARHCPMSVGSRRGGAWWPRFFGGAAAALLVALAAWVWRADGPSRLSGARPSARITAVHDAEWDAAEPPVQDKPVAPGPVRLIRGSAQITFASGAVVAIHAPASVEVLGGNRMFLRSGRVTPYVPPSAKGFTVVSPSGEVVDFGTEFSIGVGDDGKTDVFVIDGEVAVAGGHGAAVKPMHLTQGFASQFATTERQPEVTLRPLVIDHFDGERGPLLRQDFEASHPSFVRDCKLWLPIDGRPNRQVSTVHTVLDHDFSSMSGRRSVISFKAMLPDIGTAHFGRWVALVIDDQDGDPPNAAESDANLGVMLSPFWKVGMRVGGKGVVGLPSSAFRRSEEAVGPFQVVMTIDDTPAAHVEHGTAVVTTMVNGLEFIRNYPFHLPEQPRLSLHTHVRAREGGSGFAIIDDFSVSVAAD